MSSTRENDSFRIGDIRVSRIEEWQGRFAPPAGLFAGYEEAAFAPHRQAFTPDYLLDEMIYGFLQTWVLEVAGKTILFDTGAGNDKDRPGIPIFGNLQTDFLQRLERAGFDRNSVDMVICSHLHIDHVGWNTVKEGERWVPTFPNAQYILPEVDRLAWNPAGETYGSMRGAGVNAGVFEDSVQPIIDAGLAQFVSDGDEVGPGLVLRSAPGHTPGHMLLDVTSGADRALFVGDIMHHPMQIYRPDWNSVYCEDSDHARDSRRRVLELASQSRARVVPAHFGGLHSVFVDRDESGFRPAGL
jgi:glyoxylase-like metal-dependent hydrolase (beta-lactamase superfamily II)